MRSEYELNRIADIPTNEDDRESELQEFINGMGVSKHIKDHLIELCNGAINDGGEFGILEGVRYAVGLHSEYVTDFKRKHLPDETSLQIDKGSNL